jgi:hypothetical protein
MDRYLSSRGKSFYDWLSVHGNSPGPTRDDLCLLYLAREILDTDCRHEILGEGELSAIRGVIATVLAGSPRLVASDAVRDRILGTSKLNKKTT